MIENAPALTMTKTKTTHCWVCRMIRQSIPPEIQQRMVIGAVATQACFKMSRRLLCHRGLLIQPPLCSERATHISPPTHLTSEEAVLLSDPAAACSLVGRTLFGRNGITRDSRSLKNASSRHLLPTFWPVLYPSRHGSNHTLEPRVTWQPLRLFSSTPQSPWEGWSMLRQQGSALFRLAWWSRWPVC